MASDGNKSEATGALRGVRVLDFGQYIPGPLLGMLLADQGADVIKVERPEGDPARQEPAFATWNRGKRSVVLNLKTDRGRPNTCEATGPQRRCAYRELSSRRDGTPGHRL